MDLLLMKLQRRLLIHIAVDTVHFNGATTTAATTLRLPCLKWKVNQLALCSQCTMLKLMLQQLPPPFVVASLFLFFCCMHQFKCKCLQVHWSSTAAARFQGTRITGFGRWMPRCHLPVYRLVVVSPLSLGVPLALYFLLHCFVVLHFSVYIISSFVCLHYHQLLLFPFIVINFCSLVSRRLRHGGGVQRLSTVGATEGSISEVPLMAFSDCAFTAASFFFFFLLPCVRLWCHCRLWLCVVCVCERNVFALEFQFHFGCSVFSSLLSLSFVFVFVCVTVRQYYDLFECAFAQIESVWREVGDKQLTTCRHFCLPRR